MALPHVYPRDASILSSRAVVCHDEQIRREVAVKIIRFSDVADEASTHPLFTGPVERRTVLDGSEGQFNVGYITFPDGVYSELHTHTTDQVLIVTKGRGFVETEDDRVELAEGDVVWSPAGERHGHGALDGSAMTHLAIMGADNKTEAAERRP
jgi:quercetin dioxygenase-like cupin family protein